MGTENEQTPQSFHPNARQVERPLPMPVGDESRDLKSVCPAQRQVKLALYCQSNEALPQRSRVCGERSDRQGNASLGVGREFFHEFNREMIERLRIFAQLFSRAGERLRYARTELTFEHRQHRLPHPNAGERPVTILRVYPRLEARVDAELHSR